MKNILLNLSIAVTYFLLCVPELAVVVASLTDGPDVVLISVW